MYQLGLNQLNSQFNEKRPHRTHRAKWPLTHAHNKTKKKINKTKMQNYDNTATWQTATLFSSFLNVFKEGASTTV